ncbi:PrsW family intramembrane metalloprotease [Devriesea agamarum]|uniref:PrsW family intramembrane metalloprotease n=1 Tax=Devriesea agamarum TaxID=472569 RepID=UPI00071CA7BE|nr:PrsW family intramembrane metalloprotease [Devriesea agamarum]
MPFTPLPPGYTGNQPDTGPRQPAAPDRLRFTSVNATIAATPLRTILLWIAASLLGVGLLIALAFPLLWAGLGTVTFFSVMAFFSLATVTAIMMLANFWHPQPIVLTILAILWGAVPTAGIAILLETVLDLIVFTLTNSPELAHQFSMALSAPVIEEVLKGLGLLALLLAARKNFNGPLDGLVFGALIGGGFAFIENIQYYISGYEEYGAIGGGVLILMRGVGSIFLHPLFTSLTGLIMGAATRAWGTVAGALIFFGAVWPAIVLHFGWNLAALTSDGAIVLISFLVLFTLSALWLALIGLLLYDQARLMRARLTDYVHEGWLLPQEVHMLGSSKGRREAKRWAATFGATTLMQRFIKDAAELALARQRILADGPSPARLTEERHLLSQAIADRQELLSRASSMTIQQPVQLPPLLLSGPPTTGITPRGPSQHLGQWRGR